VPSLDEVFAALAGALQSAGLDVSVELVRAIVLIVLLLLAAYALIKAGQATLHVIRAVTAFSRRQIGNKFWQDAGKLSTIISFVLLLIAYGLYGHEQTKTFGQALIDLGREHLAEIVPTAILTQAILLCVYWIGLGLITGVSRRTLGEPFRLFLGFALAFAWLLLASVVPYLLAGGNPSTLGMTILALITIFGLAAPLLAKSATVIAKTPRAGLPLAIVAILMLTTLVATTVAWAYAAFASEPTVSGLVFTDFAIMTVLLLFTCFRFRAYIGDAEVPKPIPHLIDFSLAISAGAIAVISLTTATVTLGGLPPVLIAAAPALTVAAMVYFIHLRKPEPSIPRWKACLTFAIIGGLLVGPTKLLLAAPIAAFADLLPVTWG
jgi:hypothetical protein